MFDKNKKWLITGLSLMLVLSMTITGILVCQMHKDGQIVASGDAANTTGQISDQEPAENNSALLEDVAESEDTTAALTDDERLAWAEYSPVAEWKPEDTESTWDNVSAVKINLESNGIATSGNGAEISSNGQIVTISAAGTYVISGQIDEGQIIVDAADEDLVRLVLSDADIASSIRAPLFIKNAEKAVLILADGTDNSISDLRSESYFDETAAAVEETETAEEDTGAAIYSKVDLSITGSGSLSISTIWSDGITCRDDLLISQSVLDIEAGDDGIAGRDLLAVSSGTITIKSGGDGIKSSNDDDQTLGHIILSDGDFTIEAEADGIQAAGQLIVEAGDFTIQTGEGSIQALAERATENTLGEFGGGFGGGRGKRTPGGTLPDGSERPDEGFMPDTMNGATSEASAGSAAGDTLTSTYLTGADNIALTNMNASLTSDDSLKAFKAAIAIKISGGNYSIDSTDDAVHSNGIVTIEAGNFEMASGDDGIHADATVTIMGGQITISKSYEGIEGKNILIENGTIDVTASDDGINIAGGQDSSAMGGRPGQNTFSTAGDQMLEIIGGEIRVNAEGDGIDVNGAALMSGGTVIVYGPSSNANGALDYDGSFEISGGTLLAVGSSGMAQSFSKSTQTVLAFTTDIAANTEMSITDSTNNEILSVSSPRAFSSVVFTAPNLEPGATYRIVSSGTVLGQISG